MVSCHVIEIQEIGFQKFGTELWRVVRLHHIVACNVIICLVKPVSSSGVVVTLERNILLRLRSNCN